MTYPPPHTLFVISAFVLFPLLSKILIPYRRRIGHRRRTCDPVIISRLLSLVTKVILAHRLQYSCFFPFRAFLC